MKFFKKVFSATMLLGLAAGAVYATSGVENKSAIISKAEESEGVKINFHQFENAEGYSMFYFGFDGGDYDKSHIENVEGNDKTVYDYANKDILAKKAMFAETFKGIHILTNNGYIDIAESLIGLNLHLWTRNGIALRFAKDFFKGTVRTVVIDEGTSFPTAAYLSGGEEGYFTLSKSYLWDWSLNNNTWYDRVEFSKGETVETEINNGTGVDDIQLRSGDGSCFLLMFNKVNDFGTLEGNNLTAGSGLSHRWKANNIMAKVKLYETNGTEHYLVDVVNDEDQCNFNPWAEKNGYRFKLKSGWTDSSFNKIVIEKGCEFPSYDFSLTASEAKNAYVTTEEYVYRGTATDFYGGKVIKAGDCSIAEGGLNFKNRTGAIGFTMKGTDYPMGAEDWNKNVQAQFPSLNTLENIYVDDNKASSYSVSQAHINIFQSNRAFSVDLQAESLDASAINSFKLAKGTRIPSYETKAVTVNGDIKYYEVDRDYLFTKSGSEFVCTYKLGDASINSAIFENGVYFNVEGADYPTASTSTDEIKGQTVNRLVSKATTYLNTKAGIKADGVVLEDAIAGDSVLINKFVKPKTLFIADAKLAAKPDKITIDAGTKIPSWQTSDNNYQNSGAGLEGNRNVVGYYELPATEIILNDAKTFYIKNAFTLSFAGLEDTISVKYGETIGTLPEVPHTDHHENEKWVIGSTAITSESTYSLREDATATVSYTLEKMNVTFDSDGGSAVAATTVDYGKKLSAPEAPTRTGYTFVGWYVGEDAYDFNSSVTSALSLKAKWELNKYNVTFNSDGGSAVTGQEVNHGAKATEPQAPTKTGYTFAGWYVGDAAYDFDSEVTGAVQLTAHWTINSYTVSFDSDGGSTVADASVNYNAKATAPEAPTKTGYTFAGWYVGDAAYDFNTPVTGNLTLKAHWTLNQYTVSFNSDGGSAVTSQTVNHGAKATAPAAPTKTGYTFAGWVVEGTSNAYDFNAEVTGNVALKATWTINTYTVSFNSDEGSEVASQQVNYGSVATRPEDPTKEGFTFEGWYLGEELYNFETPVTGNVTLVAKWKAVPRGCGGSVIAASAIVTLTAALGACLLASKKKED